MKRFERRRVERLRRRALTIGLSFALGALADTALTWRLHEFDLGEHVDFGDRVDVPAPADPPAAVPTSYVVPPASDINVLKQRRLQMPVAGIQPSQLRDSFTDRRAFGRAHEAIDIMAARGTPVRAVDDGTVAKLFTSIAGGLTIYQFDPARMFNYYYAHLDSYAGGLREGKSVRRGEVIGYVGSTGNASTDAPHLHFAIFRVSPEREWWKGEPINPYLVLK